MSPLIVLTEAETIRLKKAVQTDSDLVVWVGDWLSHLNLFSDAQIYDILRFAKDVLEGYDNDRPEVARRPTLVIAVCDSRWVSVTGVPKFLDTEISEEVHELGEYAVTHIMCDVAALDARMHYRQGRFHGQSNSHKADAQPHQDGQQQHQSDPAKDRHEDDAGDGGDVHDSAVPDCDGSVRP